MSKGQNKMKIDIMRREAVRPKESKKNKRCKNFEVRMNLTYLGSSKKFTGSWGWTERRKTVESIEY